jgi:Protein required for attachment to host cells
VPVVGYRAIRDRIWLMRKAFFMNTKLIIVADLGLLRAYKQVQGLGDREPHLKLIEELKPEAAHQKLSDQMSDQAGRFPKTAGPNIVTGDLSAGERLNLETEQVRRLISQLAGRINALLADESVTSCSLAASAPIHKQLLEELSGKERAKISQVLASNLSKIDPSELPRYFSKPAS